jgi:hypothetical protein
MTPSPASRHAIDAPGVSALGEEYQAIKAELRRCRHDL